MEKIRVVIADNHPAFREGLCRLLADEKELEVVGQAGDGEEIVSLSKELETGCSHCRCGDAQAERHRGY